MCTSECFMIGFKKEPSIQQTVESIQAAGYEVTVETWEERDED